MYLIIFMTGLIAGSFLNSFIYRYQNKKSYSGRSYCPNCQKQIYWYDNIPILSFIALKGKCRYCKKPISFQYPLIEGLTGFTFLMVGVYSEPGQALSREFYSMANSEQLKASSSFVVLNSLLLILLLLITSLLILIAVYDLKTKEIPNGFNLTFILSSFIYMLLSGSSQNEPLLAIGYSLLAAFVLFFIFYFLVIISNETWMGGGDAKFVFGMGLLLGPAGSLLAIMIASITGSIFGISQILIQKSRPEDDQPLAEKSQKPVLRDSRTDDNSKLKNSDLNKNLQPRIKNYDHDEPIPSEWKQKTAKGKRRTTKDQRHKRHEVPFGPFLTLGTYVALVFGSNIISWYLNFFLNL